MEMLKNIFLKRMLPILCIFLLCIIPPFVKLIHELVHCQIQGGLEVGLLSLLTILVVVYFYVIGRCGIGFWRLRKKYNREWLFKGESYGKKIIINCGNFRTYCRNFTNNCIKTNAYWFYAVGSGILFCRCQFLVQIGAGNYWL